ncbi:hypothetical protein C0J52_28172, partial [Blattella germanica]
RLLSKFEVARKLNSLGNYSWRGLPLTSEWKKKKSIPGTLRITEENEVGCNCFGTGSSSMGIVRAQRLAWFGHVCRMSEDRIVKKLFQWKPLTTRCQGRPKIRWEDDVIEDLKK